jgi:hypothetical protein
MYIYDFKFDDLSTIAYNHLLKHSDKYTRCKILYYQLWRSLAEVIVVPSIQILTDISDAYESAYTIMLNLAAVGYKNKAISLWNLPLY